VNLSTCSLRLPVQLLNTVPESLRPIGKNGGRTSGTFFPPSFRFVVSSNLYDASSKHFNGTCPQLARSFISSSVHRPTRIRTSIKIPFYSFFHSFTHLFLNVFSLSSILATSPFYHTSVCLFKDQI